MKHRVQALINQYEESLATANIKIIVSLKHIEVAVSERWGSSGIVDAVFTSMERAHDRKIEDAGFGSCVLCLFFTPTARR